MANEEIITILRNAVENGDNLQSAIQITVNSGYDPKIVNEAAKYVKGGTIQNLEAKPNENLIMVGNNKKKGLFNKFKTTNNTQNQNPQSQQTLKPLSESEKKDYDDRFGESAMSNEEIKKLANPNSEKSLMQDKLKNEAKERQKLPKVEIKKKSYKKEIILLVILLFLIATLIVTVVFRNGIISFLS